MENDKKAMQGAIQYLRTLAESAQVEGWTGSAALLLAASDLERGEHDKYAELQIIEVVMPLKLRKELKRLWESAPQNTELWAAATRRAVRRVWFVFYSGIPCRHCWEPEREHAAALTDDGGRACPIALHERYEPVERWS